MRRSYLGLAWGIVIGLILGIVAFNRATANHPRTASEPENVFVAKIVSVESVLLDECLPNAWWQPAPLFKVTFDRKVKINIHWGGDRDLGFVTTDHAYLMLGEYTYATFGGRREQRFADYLQVMENQFKDEPLRAWRYWSHNNGHADCLDTIFLKELRWKAEEQPPRDVARP